MFGYFIKIFRKLIQYFNHLLDNINFSTSKKTDKHKIKEKKKSLIRETVLFSQVLTDSRN